MVAGIVIVSMCVWMFVEEKINGRGEEAME